MKLFKEHGGNDLLDTEVPTVGGYTDTAASVSPDRQTVVVSCVNRHLTESAVLTLPEEWSEYRAAAAEEVAHDDVRAQNTFDHPDEITAKAVPVTGNAFTVKPHSVLRLVLKKA